MSKKEVAVGIDIGGTNTVFGFVDRDGNILGEDRLKTTQFDEIEVFVAALYETIQVTAQKIGKGIVPLAEIFNRHTNLPVVVTNDANAAAVGEMVYGGAKGMKNFVVITLGTGLGLS